MPEAAYGTLQPLADLPRRSTRPRSAPTATTSAGALAAEDIEARPVWKPMHLQPLFAGCPARGGRVAEDLFAHGLCLPSGSNLADADRARIVGLIARCCKSC